ncbi:MAG: lyase family protein [Candidatus Woesearchaeota archaeon]
MGHVLFGRYPSKEMKEIIGPQPKDYRTLCSPDMENIFSKESKHNGWDDVWYAHMKAQKETGLPIPQEHLDAFQVILHKINYQRMDEIERILKHDVDSGRKHRAEELEKVLEGSSAWLHAGATSCTVTDNQELTAMYNGLQLLADKGYNLLNKLERFDSGLIVNQHKSDLEYALNILDSRINNFKIRGAKGTTGTQASYLELFDGNAEKVSAFEQAFIQRLGFGRAFTITGQTYPRIADYQLVSTLGVLATALSNIAEYSVSFSEELAHPLSDVKSFAKSAAHMASKQWLERTLDDSAQRRIIIEDSFKAVEYVLDRLNSAEINPIEIRDPDFQLSQPLSETLEGTTGKALELLRDKTVNTIFRIHTFAEKFKDQPCMAYTHYQVAQPTTVGKRLDLWAYNYVLALQDIEDFLESDKNLEVSQNIVEYRIATLLTQIAVAAHKQAADVRLCQHDGIMTEPFAIGQKGSSAMPHKRNPMKNERICSLSTELIQYADSNNANPYSFLLADSVLNLAMAVFVEDTPKQKGFTVNPEVIAKNFREFLPYICLEQLVNKVLKTGKYKREELYDIAYNCSIQARTNVEVHGKANNTLELVCEYPQFGLTPEMIPAMLDPMLYIGLASKQVELFGRVHVDPLKEKYKSVQALESDVKV